ncbi:MAG TPA: TetR family transcriptional regulator, partial [Candidatus Saccharimonas sp.]|nr:TetR family transcriptional regulator [Candidatus Saccharimonas sp.]
MLPKSNTTNQNKSFIEQARRAQIIEATISVLAQNGYVNTSFAKIGKQAGISASLISYHFKNKEELTEEVYKSILQGRAAHVGAKIAAAQTASDKLRAAIESDLFYMGTQPELFQALVEILFVARSKVDPATHRNDDIHAGFMPIADILK